MGASPSLPVVFTCDVPGVMEVGKIILISARVSPDPARFSVDLKCANGDIALHFNPRFDEEMPVVVCNTCSKNEWGVEERTLQMPFRQGESFEMTIAIKDSYYEVFVNGEYFLRYLHRLPFHTVTQLEFKGGIKFENSNPFIQDPPAYRPPANDITTDPPPYSPPVQDNTAAAKVRSSGRATPEQPKRADSDKRQPTKTRVDFKGADPDSDNESVTINVPEPADEFLLENKVLIPGHYLLNDITSCLMMSLLALHRRHERYSAHYMKRV